VSCSHVSRPDEEQCNMVIIDYSLRAKVVV